MQYLITAHDGPDMLEKRMEVRPRHLEGMKALGKQIIAAGGLLDEKGRMKGSLLVGMGVLALFAVYCAARLVR